MRYTADDALPSILVQPFKISSVGRWLLVEKACYGRKGLSPAEKWPSIDVVAIDSYILLKEWTYRSNIDT